MSNSSFGDTNPDGSFDVLPGASIEETIFQAIIRATTRHEAVKFNFNDVLVTVNTNSNFDLILRDWERAIRGYIEPVVGPHAKEKLSAEEIANDGLIEAKNQARREARAAEFRAEAKAHHDRVEARMQGAPAMEFSDEAAWLEVKAVNDKDSYGAGILSYAERWARMMQLEMSEGKLLKDIWNSTSFEADLEGMSGASQAIATHLLTLYWVHGMQLRQLHNAHWGSDSMGGRSIPLFSLSAHKNSSAISQWA